MATLDDDGEIEDWNNRSIATFPLGTVREKVKKVILATFFDDQNI